MTPSSDPIVTLHGRLFSYSRVSTRVVRHSPDFVSEGKYQSGASHLHGGVLTSLRRYRAIWGVAAIVSQYRAIWGPLRRSLGPPQFQEKRSRSEKAILGALGEFRGILGAALGIRNSILGIRNSILGMASHDLSNTKTTILGATPGAILGIDGNSHERFSFAPAFSERFFKNWGGPRSPELRRLLPIRIPSPSMRQDEILPAQAISELQVLSSILTLFSAIWQRQTSKPRQA